MAAENTLIITGRLGTQPEVKDKGRGKWTSARLAYSQGHYDKQAQKWIEADTPTAWFTVMANNKTGDVLATLNKGDTVTVVGRLAVDVWAPQDGTHAPVDTRTDLTIWASTVGLVSRKQAGQGSAPATGYAAPAAAPAAQQAYPTASPWETYNNPDF